MTTSLRAMQDYTYASKYARYRDDLKRRETWDEAVDRVLNMHLQKYPEIENELEWAFGMVRQKKVLGSQRALQFGGKPILKQNARLYNCISSYCDRPRFFQEAFHLLLCGCVPPDTKILTTDGPKEIQDIREGEDVLSFNRQENSYEFKKVIKTHDVHVGSDENIKVNGRFGNFTTSKKHPVLVWRNGCWEYIPAGLIKIGDIIKKLALIR